MRKYIEKYLLPIAMVVGISFHSQLSLLSPAIPYLLALMLFITYSRVRLNDIKPSKFHYILLAIQYIGSAAIYLALRPINEILAQGAMICMLTATATSAPVVTGLLGGSIADTAAYSLMSNLSVAIIAPIFLSLAGDSGHNIPLTTSFWQILRSVMPIMVLPFIFSLLLRKIAPRAHKAIASAQIISFYLWAASLTIVIGNITSYVQEQGTDHFRLEIAIGAVSLVICLLQFFFGKRIGARYGRTIAGGQSLGQKNTVLAIWLAQTYLNPLATLGPGMYVLWQNLVNSWQIWRQNRTQKETK